MSGMGGIKHDAEKLRYDLMPVDAEQMVVQVLTHGAEKYGPDNWRKVPESSRRYYAAARRHLEAWRGGELIDSESGQHHLSHAICCLLFLLQFDIEGNDKAVDFFSVRDLPDDFPQHLTEQAS